MMDFSETSEITCVHEIGEVSRSNSSIYSLSLFFSVIRSISKFNEKFDIMEDS